MTTTRPLSRIFFARIYISQFSQFTTPV